MRILVLGDSSSSGIGTGRIVYPFQLYLKLKERCRVRIENHAVPGFTTSDAARYYRTVSSERWDCVIVYLGNNEGSRARNKGTYRSRWRLTSLLPRTPRPRQLHKIVDRQRFVFPEPDVETLGIANTPQDFRQNLSTLADQVARGGCRLIIVNPVANPFFPSGLGSPRAPFFKILGLSCRLSDRVIAVDDETSMLVQALRSHDSGDFDVAEARYLSLDRSRAQVSSVARNNLAVLLAERQEYDRSISLLKSLVAASGSTAAFAACNLARVFTRLDRPTDAKRYAQLAAESDETLYRVKSAYRREIAALAGHPSVTVIDLAQLLGQEDFVDYCHPTEAGHEKLAAAIASELDLAVESTHVEEQSTYGRSYPSPDAFFDIRSSLLDYYSIDLVVDVAEISRDAVKLVRRLRERGVTDLAVVNLTWPEPRSVLEHNILHAWQHAARHPIFTHVDDLEAFGARYSWEVGRFPEFFVYRVIWSYLKHAKDRGWLAKIIPGADRTQWGLSPDAYRDRILLKRGGVVEHEVNLSLQYCSRVLAKAKAALRNASKAFEDCRAERIMTIMYWYTREAFRYGTHSRLGMLSDRWQLERVVEALCVCMIIARHHRRDDLQREIRDILQRLTRLAEVHDLHAARMIACEYEADGDEYQRQLLEVRANLFRYISEADSHSE